PILRSLAYEHEGSPERIGTGTTHPSEAAIAAASQKSILRPRPGPCTLVGAITSSKSASSRDADLARPLLPARPRLVDASDLREARRPQGERQDDRADVPPLRRLRRSGILAAPRPRMGPRR